SCLLVLLVLWPSPRPALFPYTTLFRSSINGDASVSRELTRLAVSQWLDTHPDTQVEYLDLAVDTPPHFTADTLGVRGALKDEPKDRKSTRLNSSHVKSSYAVFCLKKNR